MKIQRVIAVMIGIVLSLLAAGAQAAELKVYSSTAVKAVLEELGPQFEKATGDKLVFTFGLSSAVKKQIDEGAAFDVAILTPALIDGLAAGKIVGWFQGRMESGPRALGGRSILMDPGRAENKDVINARVKFREAFRPFCPSMTPEAARTR